MAKAKIASVEKGSTVFSGVSKAACYLYNHQVHFCGIYTGW